MNGTVDYLVGALRISIRPESTTPGPRSHIVGMLGGFGGNGYARRVFMASDLPALRRFAQVKEGAAIGASGLKIAVADAVRVGALLYAGATVALRSAVRPRPVLIYERVAVLQCLALFHRWGRSVPIVVESNGLMARETAEDRNALRLRRLAEQLERVLYRRADHVVAISDALADEIVRFAGVPRSKVLVVPNAIPDAVVRMADGLPSAPAGPKRIGFAGAVVAWQQLDLLLAAFAACVREGRVSDDLELVIVGSGPVLDGLQTQAIESGIAERVRFTGRIAPEALFAEASTWLAGYSGHGRAEGQMYHSPLKLYEYAGLGIGAIATQSDDLVALQAQGLPAWLFASVDELADALETVDRDGVDAVTAYRAGALRDVVAANSWTARASSVLEAALGLVRRGSDDGDR